MYNVLNSYKISDCSIEYKVYLLLLLILISCINHNNKHKKAVADNHQKVEIALKTKIYKAKILFVAFLVCLIKTFQDNGLKPFVTYLVSVEDLNICI
jgi:hypothetical protein